MQRVAKDGDSDRGDGGGRFKRPRIDGADEVGARTMADYQSFTAHLNSIVLKGQSLAGSTRMRGSDAFASSLRGLHREAGTHQAAPLDMRWALGGDSNAYLRLDVMPLQAAVSEWGASSMAKSGFKGADSAYLASAATPTVGIGNMFPAIARANRVGGLHAWKAHEEEMKSEHGKVAASIAPLVTWLCTIPEVRRAVELCRGACDEGAGEDGHMLRTIDALLQLLEDPLRAVEAQYAHTVRNAVSQIGNDTRLLKRASQDEGTQPPPKTEKVDSGAFYDEHRSDSNASALVVRGSQAESGERHSEAPIGMMVAAVAGAAALWSQSSAHVDRASGPYLMAAPEPPAMLVSVAEMANAFASQRGYLGGITPGAETSGAFASGHPDTGSRATTEGVLSSVPDVVTEIQNKVRARSTTPFSTPSAKGLSGRALTVLQGYAFGARHVDSAEFSPAFRGFCLTLGADSPDLMGWVEQLANSAKDEYNKELRDSPKGMAFLVDNGLKDALCPADGAKNGDSLTPIAFATGRNLEWAISVFNQLNLKGVDEQTELYVRGVLEGDLWDKDGQNYLGTGKTSALRQLFVEIDQILKSSIADNNYKPAEAAAQISVVASNVARALSGETDLNEDVLSQRGKAIVKILYGSEEFDGELLNALNLVKIGSLTNDGNVSMHNYNLEQLDHLNNKYHRFVLVDLFAWDEKSNPLADATKVFGNIRSEQQSRDTAEPSKEQGTRASRTRASRTAHARVATGLVAALAASLKLALDDISEEASKKDDGEPGETDSPGGPSTPTPTPALAPSPSREPPAPYVVEMGAGTAYEQTVGPGLVAVESEYAMKSQGWLRALENAASTLQFVPTDALRVDTGEWVHTNKISAVVHGTREGSASSAYCVARGLCATPLPHHQHKAARAGGRGGEARTQPYLDYSTPRDRLHSDVIDVMKNIKPPHYPEEARKDAINLALKPAAASAAVPNSVAPPRSDLVDDFVDLQRFTYKQGGAADGKKRLLNKQERNNLGLADPVAFALWGPPLQNMQSPDTSDAFELASLVCATEHLAVYYKTQAEELQQEEMVKEATQRLAATKLFQLKHLAKMWMSRGELVDAVAARITEQQVLTTRPALPVTGSDSSSRVLYPCDAGLAVWTRAAAGGPKDVGTGDLPGRDAIKEVLEEVHDAVKGAFFDVFSSAGTNEDEDTWGEFAEPWKMGVGFLVEEAFKKKAAQKGKTGASGAAAPGQTVDEKKQRTLANLILEAFSEYKKQRGAQMDGHERAESVPEPGSPVASEEMVEEEAEIPIFTPDVVLVYEEFPNFLHEPSVKIDSMPEVRPVRADTPTPTPAPTSKYSDTKTYLSNVFSAIARKMGTRASGGGGASSLRAAKLAFGAIGIPMAIVAIAEISRLFSTPATVPRSPTDVLSERIIDGVVDWLLGSDGVVPLFGPGRPTDASQTDARMADVRMAPEGRPHTLFDASQPHIQNTRAVGAIPTSLPLDLPNEVGEDIRHRSAATGVLRDARIHHLYMARSADEWPTMQTPTPSRPPKPPAPDFSWGHAFSDVDPELLDVDVLRGTLLRAKRAFEDKVMASNSVQLVQSHIDAMDRLKDECDDGDEMTPFHNRRKVLWDDALREAAISNDRLYAFVRQLTGTLSEAVDAVAVIDDSSLAEQSRKIVAARERAAKVASDAHVQLVKALVGAVLKDSRLSLDVAGDEGGSGNTLNVSTTSLRRHAEALRAGATGGSGALTAAIDLDNLLASKEDTVPLTDLLERLKVVGVAMQQAAMTSYTNGGNTQMTDVSMDFVAAPRNSMLLRWKPDAKAAIRRAFDLLVGEIKASHAGHLGCGFATRLPTAFELLEGVNDSLSNLFAQLTAHVLVASRMSSPAYAPYLQRSTLATNGRQVRIELERCVRAWSEHCDRFPRPSFRHGERGHYFGVS